MAIKITAYGPVSDIINPATFDISRFKANIGNYHKTSHFQMYVQMPTILSNVSQVKSTSNMVSVSQNMTFDIEKVVMPGVSFATEDVRRHGYGFIERQPYSPIMETINCIVRSDSEGKNYDFWQTWFSSIMNFQIDSTIDEDNIYSFGPYGAHYYELNYKSDPNGGYSTTVQIAAINESSEAAIQLILAHAYPIYIGDMNYDWGDMNNIVKFPVKLTYSYWKSNRIYTTNNSNTTSSSTSG